MWKALIADDEAFSRYALRTFLSKRMEQIEVVAEAADGDEALALSIEHQPDLLFLDIRMPGKNGIEAAEAILKLQRGIKIVMLTAYDHFSYIQKALNLGVKGYLLKPFQQDALEEKIGSLIRELESEGAAEIPFMNRELEKITLYGEARLLELLLFTGSTRGGEADELVRSLDLSLPRQGLLLLLKGGAISDRERLWIARELSPRGTFLTGKGFGTAGIIFFHHVAADHERAPEELKASFSRFMMEQKRFSRLAALFLPVSGIRLLPGIFRRGLSLLMGLEEGEIRSGESCSDEDGHSWFDFPHEQEEAFLSALAKGNPQGARDRLSELAPLLDNCDREELELVDHIGELIVRSRRKGRIAGFGDDALYASFSLRRIAALSNRKDALALLEDLLDQVSQHQQGDDGDVPVLKLARAYLYTRENLFRDISLEMVADAVGISPQYLSKRFKEEYGRSFTEYVTAERIDRASFLLGTGELSVKEVGSRVGYGDANYFSRVFKKSTGLTPQQYRSRLSGEQIPEEG